jgi:hypothetical protein
MDEHHEHKTHTAQHSDYAKKEENHIEQSERKPVDSKKSMTFIITILGMIILIIGATILLSKYVFVNKNEIEYNHYSFEKFEGNKWMTQQLIRNQLYDIPFYNNPMQVLDIPVDPKSISIIREFSTINGTVYIAVDPNESSRVVLAGVEYARILGKGYDIYNMNVKSALSREGDYITESPIITCKNQSQNTLVLYQVITDKNLVSVHGNCIILESKNATESIRVADAFSFRLLNIITD